MCRYELLGVLIKLRGRRGAPTSIAHGSSDGPVVVEAAPGAIDTWEVVLLANENSRPFGGGLERSCR